MALRANRTPETDEMILDPVAEQPSEPARPHRRQQKGRPAERPLQPVQVVRELAKRLGVPALHRRLEGVRLSGGRVEVPRAHDASPSPLNLDPSGLPALSDVTITSSDGVALACHKCVLAARLQYFSVMFSSCWAESVASEAVRLSMPAAVLTVLVAFCYTGEARLQPDDPEPLQTDDLELLCGLLAAADHMLATRLKEMCEVALSRQLTLKNAVELMEFSAMYGAEQLKSTCMQFICLNLAAVMENRSLDQASEAVMDELTRFYRCVNPLMRHRLVRPSGEPPTLEHVRAVHEAYPVGSDEPAPAPTEPEVRSRPPPRRRPAAGRSTSTSPVPEFTLVTRKRHSERPAVAPPPASTATLERYIPGITPKPRPIRAVRPVSPSDEEPTPPAHVTSGQSTSAGGMTSPIEAFPSLGSAFPALNGEAIGSAAGAAGLSPTS
ncbi:inhibitor of Bruton tyrosine kinase-like [Pollicipes pollicipes]|uniref:inhibitor of Bruton tyrosine kinase-like n=1 Tax=Pollicipes pollicipes TaxID=41117 RepID=UPI0018854F1F|nr:inhibitor of Bruton tyrosine kinase-like [Pollicipes pollicipes]